MNRKTTLLSLKCLIVFAFANVVNAQQIYTNGPLSTGATSNSGAAAAAGYTWSEAQNDIGNTTESNSNSGLSGYYNTAGTLSFQLGDDFIVPAGQVWNVTSFEFYAYQTAAFPTALPFNSLRIQLFNGVPGAVGTTLVAGDMTTNVYDAANTTDAMMFRLFNSAVPNAVNVPGQTRRIWKVRGNLTATLSTGTYWVVYQMRATNDGTVFFPPVTVTGNRALPGWNGRQNIVASTAAGAVLGWAGILDVGNPVTAPDVACDMPFNINGTVTLGVNENTFEASISLSPNPVKDILSISVATGTTINSYEIFDVNGKVVKAMNSSTSNISEINVSELSVGNYILKLQSDKGIASKKFIKE